MKKKIFVLTHNYPRDEHDFAGIFIKNLNNDLADDFDFTVCPIRFGTTMHKLYKNPLNWPKLYSYFRESRKKAEAELAKDKYDLIWAHWWMPPGMIAAKLSRQNGDSIDGHLPWHGCIHATGFAAVTFFCRPRF